MRHFLVLTLAACVLASAAPAYELVQTQVALGFWSDWHDGTVSDLEYAQMRRLIEAMDTLGVTRLVHTGDICTRVENGASDWEAWVNDIAQIHTIALDWVPGNHDARYYASEAETAYAAGETEPYDLFMDLYPRQFWRGRPWYVQDHGLIRLLVCVSNDDTVCANDHGAYRNCNPPGLRHPEPPTGNPSYGGLLDSDSEQRRWLFDQVTERQRHGWTFLAMHRTPFSGFPLTENNCGRACFRGLSYGLMDSLSLYGVDAVLGGDSHVISATQRISKPTMAGSIVRDSSGVTYLNTSSGFVPRWAYKDALGDTTLMRFIPPDEYQQDPAVWVFRSWGRVGNWKLLACADGDSEEVVTLYEFDTAR